VVGLLTLVTLSVLQLGFALHIRNTLLDAAAEGARFSALADNTADDGVARTRELITTAVGANYAGGIEAESTSYLGSPATAITVTAPLPVLGLIGIADGIEVVGHAAREMVD